MAPLARSGDQDQGEDDRENRDGECGYGHAVENGSDVFVGMFGARLLLGLEESVILVSRDPHDKGGNDLRHGTQPEACDSTRLRVFGHFFVCFSGSG